METLVNQFKSFLLELPSSRQGGKKGLSKVSVKNYLSDIRRFLDWLSQYQPQISSAVPQRLSSDHFQAYLDFLTHQDLPHSTISRHFSSLRRFATFIEIVYHQPPLIIPTITSPDSTPKPEPTSIQTSSPNLLSSFSQYLKDQQKSASTVRNYLSDIRHFLAWVDQHPDFKNLPSAQQLDSSLEPTVIDQYSHYLDLTNTPSSTSSRRLSSLNIFTQFATNQGLVTPKAKPEANPSRLKPIPALSWLKPKTSSRPGFNLNLPNFIQKPITRLTSSPAYRSYHQLPFTPYLHLALLVLFTSAFALFGFRQIIIQSERISAYPSTPNRPTRQLSFQGRLTDSSGTPIVTPINATFKLWDQETGGTEGTCSGGAGEDCLYSTTTCSVDPDQDGIFNVLLGDGACGSEIPAGVFTENTAVWLEVEVATETLTPRQPIATVAYALNSETVSGIPVSASGSATVNTLFFMNSSGEIVLGEQNPSIVADSGNFTLQGEALTLSTTPFSEGDITIAPDGIGQVNFIGGTTTDDFIRVVNANLTTGSLISGYVGNNNNTGELLRLSSGSSETDRFVVTTGGQTTIDALAGGKSAFIVNQLNSGPIFTASASGTPKFTINNSGTITLANNTVITDDTNYTRFSRGIAVGSNETYHFNASGNINANNLTLSGTTTLNGLTYTWPSTQSTNYVLSTNGSGTLSWVDPAAAAAGSIYWLQSDGAVYPKNATVDLLVGGNSTASAIFSVNSTLGSLTLKDSSLNTLFSVSPSGLVSNVPSSFTSSGNVSFAYDLLLTNQTASSIKSNAPLTIEAGESFESNDLTLKTYNQGSVVIDSILAELAGGLSVTDYATISSSLALGTSSAPAGAGHLSMSGNLNADGNLTVGGTTTLGGLTYTWPGSQTNNYVLSTNGSGTLSWVDPASAVASTIYWTQTAGALHPKNATVDLLVGSNASASAIFRVDATTGNLVSLAGSKWMPRSDSTSALNIANAAGTSFVTFDTTNQRVGIGTSSPNNNLHIYSATDDVNYGLYLQNQSPSHTGYAGVLFGATNSSYAKGGLIYGTGGSYGRGDFHFLQDSTTSTDRPDIADSVLTIKNSGNVGIGTTSPLAKLQVNTTTATLDEQVFRISGDASAINVNWDFAVGNKYSLAAKSLAISGSSNGGGDIAINPSSGLTTPPFVIKGNTGYVGINTISPSYELDVNGDARLQGGDLYLTNSRISDSLSSSYLRIDPQSDKVIIYDGGNAQTFQVYEDGSHWIEMVGSNTLSEINTQGAGNNLRLNAMGGTITVGVSDNISLNGNLYVQNSSGFVGIGNASPTEALDITGNLKLSGTTTLNNITYTWPASQSTNYVLTTDGSGGLSWSDPAAAVASTIYWTQTAGALHPKNATVDLLVGSNASTSAIFRVDTSTGNLISVAGSKWMPRSDSTSALNIANAAGSPFVTFDTSSQRVGIGTTSPSNVLTVQNTTSTYIDIKNSTGSTSDLAAGLRFYPVSDIGTPARIEAISNLHPTQGTAYSAGFKFITRDRAGGSYIERDALTIAASGKVGIGTTDPTSLLHLATNTTYPAGKSVFIADQLESQDILTASASGTPRLTILNSGNLQFHQASDITTTTGALTLAPDSASNIQFFSSSNTLDSSGNLTLAGNLNLTSGDLQTGGTSRITNAGNLTNIGTTQFNGLTYTWPGSQSSNYILSTDGSGTLSWVDPAGAAAAAIYWEQSGGALHPKNSTVDLLIGSNASASAVFRVDATSGDLVSLSGANWMPRSDSTTALNIANAAGTSFVTFDTLNQRLGIGTSSPSYRLDIGDSTANETIRLRSSGASTISLNGYYSTNPTSLTISSGGSDALISNGSGNNYLIFQDYGGQFRFENQTSQNLLNISNGVVGLGGTSANSSPTLYVNATNVGIGTTSPTSLLSVGSSSQFQVDSSGRIVSLDGVAHTIDDVSGNLTLTSNSTTVSINDALSVAGTVTANDFLLSTDSDTAESSHGAPAQRRWKKTVTAGNIQELGSWQDTEGDVQLLVAVSSETGSNSGTNLYLIQGGYNQYNAAWSEVIPYSEGLGHGQSTTGFKLMVRRDTGYQYSLGVGIPSGLANKTLQASVTELKGGMNFTDNSSVAAVAYSSAATFYSHNSLYVGGNIGINTATPTEALDITGNLKLSGTTTLNNITYTWPGSQTNNYVLSTNGSGTLSWVDPASAVASTIYWTQTAGALHPKNATVDLLVGSSASASAIFRVDATTGNLVSLAGSKWMPRSDSTTALNIANAAGTSFVTFDTTNQRVGIGTSSPNHRLETSEGSIYFSLSSALTRNATFISSSGTQLKLNSRSVDPSFIQFTEGPSQVSQGAIGVDNSTDAFYITNGFFTSGTKIFTADFASANIGIGITSPSEKLDVAGNATVSGNLTFTGSASTIANRLMQPLTIGDSQTGDLQFFSSSNTLSSTGNLTLAGNINLISGDLQTGGTSRLTNAGNLTNIGTTQFNGLTYTWPASHNSSGYILSNNGSGTLTWIDPATAAAGSIYWLQSGGAVYPKNATVDLLVGGNSTASAIFAIDSTLGSLTLKDSSLNTLFSVSPSGLVSNVPSSFTSSGNVSFAYDLLLTNQTASSIKSNAPLTIEAGESFESNHLTLKTYNQGNILLDSVLTQLSGGLSVSSYATISSSLALGTSSAPAGVGHLSMSGNLNADGNLTVGGTTTLGGLTYTWPGSQTNNYVLSTNGSGTLSWVDPASAVASTIYWTQTAGALHPKNATVDLLVGSNASASAIFRVDATTGDLVSLAGSNWMPRSDSTTALNIANAAGTSFVTFDTTNQRVGIGTSSPVSPLSVGSSSQFQVNSSGIIASIDGVAHTIDDVSGNLTLTSNSATVSINDSLSVSGNITATGYVQADDFRGGLYRTDDRSIAPADFDHSEAHYVFTSYNNSSSSPYADGFVFRGWNDSSGGNDNLISFSRGSIAARMWQQTFGSATNFTNYEEFTFTGTGGTTNYIPKYTDANTIGNSAIIDVSGNIGIGDTTPASLLSVGNGDLFQVDSSGRVVSIDGVAHTIDDVSGNLTLTSNSTIISLNDNVTFAGTTTLNGLTYTWPSTQSTNYVLSTNGSGTLSWVDPVGAAATVIYWNQANGSLFPKNESVDLLVGGSATASAKFAFINVNSGTPTASISGTTANVATYLTGEGNLATTNMAPLTIGGATTGPIQLSPKGTAGLFVDGTGNIGIGTTTPSYKLDVTGDIRIDGGNSLRLRDGSTQLITLSHTGTAGSFYNYVGDLQIFNIADADMIFRTNNTTRLQIGNTGNFAVNTNQLFVQQSTGNVGIGNSSPSSLLSVGSSSQFQVDSTGSIVNLDGVAHTIDDVSGNLSLTSNSTTVSINDNLSLAGNITSIGGVAHSISNSSGDLQLSSNSTTVSINDNLNVTGSINSTTGYYYGGTSSPLSLELTRTIPATIDDYVEIGNVSLTNGAHNLRISITVPTSGFSVAKTYIIPMKYNQATSWQKVAPISDTGPYSTNNFDLDIQVSANTASLRIRRTAGATVGTAYVRVESTGYTADAFTATSATGSTTAPTGIFSSTPLAQVEGKVGIGTTSPAEALDITGNLKLSGTTTLNNITYTWPSSQTATYVLSTDGSGGLTWTDPAGAAASAIYWDQSGGALYPKNATVDLLVGGSASASAIFRVEAATGNLISLAGANWMPRSDSTSALNIANAAGSPFVTFDTTNQRVGIGTSSPSAPLHVDSGTWESIFSDGTIDLKHSNGNTYGKIGNMGGTYGLQSYVSYPITFRTNNLERVRIDWTNGNLGIGTTSPSEKLDVAGNATVSGNLTFTGSASTIANRLMQPLTIGDSQTGDLQFYSSSNTLSSTGNLTLAGNLNLTSGDLQTGGTSRLTNAGNLTNIGTTQFNGLTYTWPASHNSSGYILSNNGSGTLTWVDPAAAAAGSIYWLQSGGAVYPKNATVDLLVGGNSTASAIFAVNSTLGSLTLKDSSLNTLFSVSPSGLVSNVPSSFTSSGNVSFAYDLLLTNQTSSSIKSNAPLTIEAGESFESNHLTLKTYNQGNILLDSVLTQLSGGLSVSSYATISSSLALGNTNAAAGPGHLNMTGNLTMDGNLNLTSGALQTNSTTRLTNTGNLTNIGTTQFNGLTYTWPTTHETSGYVLSNNGSGTLTWVDANSAASGSIYWTQTGAAVHPKNSTVDLLVGGSATSSAKFAVLNINSGTPTASISGTTANVATYLTGQGNLATTNMAPLTIGGSTTGSLTLDENTTITGNLALSGNEADLTFSGTGNHDITASAGTLRFGAATLTGAITGNSQNITGLNNLTGVTSTFSTSVTTPLLTNAGNLTLSATGANNILFSTNGTERWRVTSTGILQSNGAQTIQTSNANLTLATGGGNGHVLLMPNGTGNVGINNASPAYKLDVTGDINFTGALRANGTAGTTGQVLVSQGTSNPVWSDISGAIGGDAWLQGGNSFGVTGVLGTNDNYNLQFETNNTTRMTLDTSGNIGINTTSPTARLDVAGTASLSGTLTFRGTTDPKIDILNGENLGIRTSSGGDTGLSERLTVLSNGNIGIGDTTPASLLTVGNGDLFQVNSSGRIIRIEGVAHTIDDVSGNLTLTSNSTTISLNDNVTFAGTTTLNGLTYTWPGSQTANYVLSTNGSGTLTWVAADAAAAGSIYWTLTNEQLHPKNASWHDLMIGGTSTASAKFFAQANTGDGYFSGELGLGTTTPTAKLDIQAAPSVYTSEVGNIRISNASDTTEKLYLGFDNNLGTYGSGYVQSSKTGTTWLPTLINPNGGYVGINNTSPSRALHVEDDSGIYVGDGTKNIQIFTSGTDNDISSSHTLHLNYNNNQAVSVGEGGTSNLYVSGSVGIGNTSPTSLFSVGSSSQFQVNSSGNIVNLGGAAHSISNASGNLTINSAGTLVLADTNIQLSGGSTTFDVYNNAADTTFTINNSSATYRSHLSLEGQLKLGTYTATPSGIAAGAVYYDTTLDRPYYFNGLGNWVPFSAGEGGDGSKWTITDGSLHPNNSTLDLTIGGSSTSSAAFAFTGISSSTRTATISGNLALSVPTGSAPTTSLNILNGGSFNIKTSVGGDAGLASRLFISNDGKVGIGTTSPLSELHIPNGTIRTDGFVSESDWGSFGFNMYWDNTQSQWEYASNGYASLIQQDGTNGGLYIATATSGTAGNLASWSKALTIDVDGNVGIGTDTPQAKLDIAGASSTITNTSGDITINSASGKISFAGDSLNNFLHATASGQIKPGSYGSDPYPIGDGAIIYRSDLGQLNYYNGTSWQAIGSGSGSSYWNEFDGLIFPTAYSVYDLAVGGDTTASAKFFVDHSTGNIKIADTAGTDFHTIANDGNNLKITGSSNGSKVILQPDLQINGGDILGSAGATRISLIDSLSLTSISGFLAIDRAATISAGLASDLTLHLKGAASQTANYMAITSNGGSTGNIFAVDSSGNVGIGRTSPSAKLDVAGSATISGTLAVGVMNQADAGTCNAAAEGRIFYDKGVRLYKACTYNSDDSSYAWRPLGGLSDQHRRDISTDSVVNNQVIRKGWTYSQGAAVGQQATVAYGITFDDVPIVVAARAGTKSSGAAPTSLSECNSDSYYIEKGVQMASISTTGFTIRTASGAGSYDGDDRVCYTWIAIGTYSSGYGADLAEYYLTHDASLDAAEIVAIDPDNDIAVTKADPTTNPAVIGIVSTQAGAILGNKDGTTPGVETSITGQEVENGSKTVPVALAGRVPVKVSLENGPIYRGDALTLSPTLPGTAVKATTPGPIIGRALENFTGTATIVDSLDPDQIDNEQELEQEAFDDLNQGIGKIMVFIQNSYYSPVMTASSATSSATIAFDHQGNLINPNENLTAQAQAATQTDSSFFDRFISLIVKNLTALNITSRSITTQELVSPLVDADQVTTNTLTTNLIKPQSDSDLIISLNNQSATTPAQLLITDSQENTVTSIDSSGNATFSGELVANSAKFDSLEVGNLKANQIEGLTNTLSQIKSASEAAKLFLDRLTAKHTAQDESLSATAQQLVSTSSSQLLSALEDNFTLDSDGTHLALTGLSSDYAYFSDYLAVEGTLMTNDLYVENNLITSSISSPLDAGDQTLYLQPTGTGAINLLAGLLILDESGTVSLNGNLIVTGTLESGSATISGTLDLRATNLDNSGEATHSGFGRLLSIYNEQGEQVASVNASGSAEFNDLTTRQIIIAASQDSTPSANQASTSSNTTIGTATIPAGELTTYIENNNISDTTLIYLTPISDTKNQVLYVKNKYSCPVDAPLSCQPFFTVAINQPTTQDIQFNYWLIQTQ